MTFEDTLKTPKTPEELIRWKAWQMDILMYATRDFDDPNEEINGANFIDWFTDFRLRILAVQEGVNRENQ